jgi:hypothetical protein
METVNGAIAVIEKASTKLVLFLMRSGRDRELF